MDKIVVTLWITFGIYLMVLLAIMADLWSGVRKANAIKIFDLDQCTNCRVSYPCYKKDSFGWSYCLNVG